MVTDLTPIIFSCRQEKSIQIIWFRKYFQNKNSKKPIKLKTVEKRTIGKIVIVHVK